VFTKFGLKCGAKPAALIAERGRGVPRKIVGLCEQIRDIACGKGKATVSIGICESAFESLCIDPIGLARLDVEVLKILSNNLGAPVGLGTLASLVGEDSRALEETVEPFLMHKGLIADCNSGQSVVLLLCSPFGLSSAGETVVQH
jgi:Holliday junction DNA helicase RuvB